MAVSAPGGLELGQKLRAAQHPFSGYREAQGETLERRPLHLGWVWVFFFLLCLLMEFPVYVRLTASRQLWN